MKPESKWFTFAASLSAAVAFSSMDGHADDAEHATHPSVSAIEVLEKSPKSMRLIFLGSGSSMGNPWAQCILDPAWKNSLHCKNSHLAMLDRPDRCRNYRCNSSLIVQVPVEGDKCGHILIDCGKHFRESIVRWGPRYGVTAIDAILLTNDLASAVLGLDDIRLVDGLRKDIPIIVGRRHFEHVQTVFKYMLNETLSERTALSPDAKRHTLTPFLFGDFESIRPLPAISFAALPLGSDDNHMSYGFIFGRVAYLSKVSAIPEATMRFLREQDIEVLIIEAFTERKSRTHFSLRNAIETIDEIKPRRAFLTGVGGDLEHVETNLMLRERFPPEGNIDVQLAHDGLAVEVEFDPDIDHSEALALVAEYVLDPDTEINK